MQKLFIAAVLLGTAVFCLQIEHREVPFTNACHQLIRSGRVACKREDFLQQVRYSYDTLKSWEKTRRPSAVTFIATGHLLKSNVQKAFGQYRATPKEMGFTAEEYVRRLNSIIERVPGQKV